MSKRLFVGNLPFSITEDELHALFTAKGNVVSTKLITDKFTGQSKGFGFVEMSDDNEADEAINSLNNSESNGRKIVVNVARPMEKREGGFKGNKGGFRKNRSW